MDDKELMDIFLKIAIGIIGYILGGLTVHVYYRSKKTNINITNSGEINSASGGSVVANDYHPETNLYISGTPSPELPEPSEQAKSIMMEMARVEEVNLVTFERLGIVEELLLPNAKITIPISNKIAVPRDIKTLVAHGYLSYTQPNSSGAIYAIEPEGLEYGKKLLEENRGNTSIRG